MCYFSTSGRDVSRVTTRTSSGPCSHSLVSDGVAQVVARWHSCCALLRLAAPGRCGCPNAIVDQVSLKPGVSRRGRRRQRRVAHIAIEVVPRNVPHALLINLGDDGAIGTLTDGKGFAAEPAA